MITTYRNKRTNTYIVDNTFDDKYKMTLIPFISCCAEPCKLFLNRKYYTNDYKQITKKEHLKSLWGKIKNDDKVIFAPTVIDIYTNN